MSQIILPLPEASGLRVLRANPKSLDLDEHRRMKFPFEHF